VLAAIAIFGSVIALAYRPVRITPFTILISLIAAGIGGRHQKLAAVALVISVLTGGGIVAPVLSGLWHGALTFGLTGAAGTMAKSRKPAA